MSLRVVAFPLVAAILVGSPAMSTVATAEQMVRGQGPRDRSGDRSDGGDAATARGRDGGTRSEPRSANRRDDDREQQRGRDGERGPRVAVPRADRDRDNGPRVATRGRDYDRPVIVRNRPNVNINIGGPRYYGPAYYDRWARHHYRWSPIGYVPWSLIYGAVGYSNFGIYASLGAPYGHFGNYGYGYPHAHGGYSPWRSSGYDIGGVRLKIRPRDAQVFVDGYYAGLVDDFDGTFQALRLEAGGHKIEIHLPGYEDLELDVHVQPGRTITLEEYLRPRP